MIPVASANAVSAARPALLAAAARLARSQPLTALSPAQVCAEARCTDAEYHATWADAASFERELMTALLDEVRDAVVKTTLGMNAGLPRLKLSIETYLEAHLARHALRELMLRLRADTASAPIVRSRIAGFTLMLEMELKSLRWQRAKATARLFTAAILEIAQAEYESGRAAPDLRATLFRYFDNRLA